MVENVQCPVCTLFLHAGMNLSDHLETHPKEQVIKALVQMTIARSGNSGAANGILATVLPTEHKLESTYKTKVTTSSNQKHEPCPNPTINTANALPEEENDCLEKSLNYANKSGADASLAPKEQIIDKPVPQSNSSCEDIKGVISLFANSQIENASHPYQHNENSTAVADLKCINAAGVVNETQTMPTDFSIFPASRYEHQQSSSTLSQLQQQQQLSVTSLQNVSVTAHTHRLTSLPSQPPLPPAQSMVQLSTGFQTTIPQAQTTQLTNSNVPITQRSHQHHHPQNMKIVYSSNLPPPPPLQLFSYQGSLQPQHQKPPPAYGAAISQIRSQHNQTKQHGTMAATSNQQQQHQHHQQHHQSHLHSASSSSHSSIQILNAKQQMCQQNKQSELPPPSSAPSQHMVVSGAAATGSPGYQKYLSDGLGQQQQSIPQLQHNTSIHQSNFASNPLSSTLKITSVASRANLMSTSAPPQLTPTMGHTGSPAVVITRQTNSPFASLLATTSPSPSSVLRYAESPVAHYLERDNGDFIVQETPKHIVECVEKDNGEFSVIERIYQSPPSVLHIHDDDDDEQNESVRQCNDNGQNDSSDDTAKAASIKADSVMDDEDEFLSIGSESEQEDDNCPISDRAKRNENSRGKNPNEDHHVTKDLLHNSSNAITASSGVGVSSTINNSSAAGHATSCSTPNMSTAITTATRRKSSKNTITVLSDVQLNLNEYLDLVGNIIASSKIASQRNATLSATVPIPLVKVEKEEPLDDYEMSSRLDYTDRSNDTSRKTPISITDSSTAPIPPIIANKNETDEIIETNFSKIEPCAVVGIKRKLDPTTVSISEDSIRDLAGVDQGIAAASCSSNATSVIRMAMTSQQHQYNHPTTSLPSQHEQQHLHTDIMIEQRKVKEIIDENIAEDLSKPQIKFDQQTGKSQQHTDGQKDHNMLNIQKQHVPFTPPVRKGPKKLVIKPKSSKTDLNINNKASSSIKLSSVLNEEEPTTSTKAQIKMKETAALLHSVGELKIKSEPTEQNLTLTSVGILEQHLKNVHCKDEKAISNDGGGDQLTKETTACKTLSNIELKVEKDNLESFSAQKLPENVVNDARVLLEFANSKKHMTSVNFLSSSSIFTSSIGSSGNGNRHAESGETVASSLSNASVAESSSNISLSASLRCDDEFIAVDASDVQEIVISSSYSSQTASNTTPLNTAMCSAINANALAVPHQRQQQHHHPQQPLHSFTDYSFSFLYGAGQPVDTKCSLSPMYQPAQDNTTAATLASGSTSVTVEDSTSAHATQKQQQQQQHLHPETNNRFGVPTTSNTTHNANDGISAWYHHHNGSSANSDFEAALVVECGTAVDGCSDVSKYLDLDTCKRESLGMQNVTSSTSSSFTAAITESSMAGGCTADALNIRTDEKMPAKGEISEQESNCDIENSWSQPMYGDISARFFKNSFPGVFHQENGWHHEEYFNVQDLSASTTAAANANCTTIVSSNNNIKSSKSFDFRLPLEATTSGAAINGSGGGNSTNCSSLHILASQSTDVMPSTSAASNKKKRKRTDGILSKTATTNGPTTRILPTATITSQQLLFHQQLQQHHMLSTNAEYNLHLAHQQHDHTTASAAQPPLTMITADNVTTVASCSSVGNALPPHIPQPQKQQLRKKIYQCTHCMMEFSKLKDRNSHMIEKHNYIRQNRRLICARPSTTATITSSDIRATTVQPSCSANAVMQSTQNVDVIEDSKQGIVKIELDQASEQQQSTLNMNSSVVQPKSEFIDAKDNLLVPLNGDGRDSNGNASSTALLETKHSLQQQPRAITTPATKLATLYRMLVSYNISTLKQTQNLSELEEKLMESSIFFCYVCRSNFSSVKLYDAHLAEHPAECFTCGKKFQRWKNFSLHLKRHLGWKEFGCNICDKKFVVRSALVEHMRMHTGLTPLKCKICGKNFKRYSNLTQHRKRHGRQIVRKKEYVCYCGEVLPSKARFLWHKETHDAKPKCCPYCCDRFVHANSLRRHIRLAHSDKFDYTEPMECPMCKQIFAKSSIKAHMATHSMGTQHDCAICNKSFSTKWNLKIHSWVHANRTAKPFKCEHCPKAFVREVDFKNHINAHKQIKPYTCEYCGCKFIRKYNYMRHRREHHGNKKFTCELCKKSFHRHYYLIEHRRIHTGERPFVCTICGKSSTTKTNHNKHLKIHHSRDPFTVEA